MGSSGCPYIGERGDVGGKQGLEPRDRFSVALFWELRLRHDTLPLRTLQFLKENHPSTRLKFQLKQPLII